MKSSIVLVLLLIAGTANAGVYRCVVNGATVFTDSPCASKAERETQRIDTDARHQISKQNGNGPTSYSKAEVLDEVAEPEVIEACMGIYRPKLRDPRGAYSTSATYVKSKKTGRKDLVVDARATNGFGGYVARNLRCTVTDEGQIDAEATKLWEAFFTLDVDPSDRQ